MLTRVSALDHEILWETRLGGMDTEKLLVFEEPHLLAALEFLLTAVSGGQ
jgi:hypothetical protein